jgi:acylphosphatase
MPSLTRAAVALGLLLFLTFPVVAGEDKPMTARHVYYSGKVQGVGFRATTAAIARDHPVTGWVKNLDDGRVELLVEGREDAVDKFLEAVRKRWKDNITKEDVKKETAGGKFKKFEIVE